MDTRCNVDEVYVCVYVYIHIYNTQHLYEVNARMHTHDNAQMNDTLCDEDEVYVCVCVCIYIYIYNTQTLI